MHAPSGAKIHPRGQATFSRVLGHYVREEKALDLMTALRKMTLMPAQRLEKRAPMFKDKDEFAWERMRTLPYSTRIASSTKQHMKNRCGIRRGFNLC